MKSNGSKNQIKKNGTEKAPFYRIVVADSRSPRDGRFIEEIGTYDPTRDPSVYKIDEEAAKNGWQTVLSRRSSWKTLQISWNRKIRRFCYAASCTHAGMEVCDEKELSGSDCKGSGGTS